MQTTGILVEQLPKAECLTSKHALNKFYRGDFLAEILNQIAGLQGDDALSAKNIAKVFNGDEGDNYTINYNDKVELKLECLEGVGQNDILSVYRQERSDRNDRGSKKFAIAGRFGIKKAMDNFTKFDKSTDSIKLTVLTGDTGGGSAVQNLITEVKKLHVMSQDCAFANCLLHGLNKPTENASVAVFGKQGIGHRTCWQLLYLWSLLRKRAKLDSDVKHLNEMWAEVVGG
jgi:hypothetical protein